MRLTQPRCRVGGLPLLAACQVLLRQRGSRGSHGTVQRRLLLHGLGGVCHALPHRRHRRRVPRRLVLPPGQRRAHHLRRWHLHQRDWRPRVPRVPRTLLLRRHHAPQPAAVPRRQLLPARHRRRSAAVPHRHLQRPHPAQQRQRVPGVPAAPVLQPAGRHDVLWRLLARLLLCRRQRGRDGRDAGRLVCGGGLHPVHRGPLLPGRIRGAGAVPRRPLLAHHRQRRAGRLHPVRRRLLLRHAGPVGAHRRLCTRVRAVGCTSVWHCRSCGVPSPPHSHAHVDTPNTTTTTTAPASDTTRQRPWPRAGTTASTA